MGSTRNASKSPPPAGSGLADPLAAQGLGRRSRIVLARRLRRPPRLAAFSARRSPAIRSFRSPPSTSTSRRRRRGFAPTSKPRCSATPAWSARSRCSTITQRLQQRVRDAFAFHPWVASVRTDQDRACPRRSTSSCEYRRPVAAVEPSIGDTVSYPADRRHGRPPAGRRLQRLRTPLPAADFRRHRPAARRRALGRRARDRRRGAGRASSPTSGANCGWSRSSPRCTPQVRGDAQLLRVRDHDQRRHADRLGRRARPRTGRRRIAVRRQAASGCSITPPARPARFDRRPGVGRRAQRPGRATREPPAARRQRTERPKRSNMPLAA